MRVLRSLRGRVVGGMAILLALVFGLALLGVNSIDALDRSVDKELSLLLESTDLSNGLIASLSSEVRAAEQYLVVPSETSRKRFLDEGDSAYVYHRRYRILGALTTSDRYIVNKIAANQAQLEVDYARAHDAIIIEDDYDGEFRAAGGPIKALKNADEGDVVFYVGTFSKSTLPNIRLGFLLPPRWAARALLTAKVCIDGPCSMPAQAAMCGFIDDGHLTHHIGRMRRVYGARRQLLLDGLRADFGEWLVPVESAYGMHVTALSTGAVDVDAVAQALVRRNVRIRNLGRYYLGPATQAGLVFGFGTMDEAAISRAMPLVRAALAEGG